jgi:hypothetical protein
VETTESYLERKHREISLINSCLVRPFAIVRPRSPAAAIDQKFLLAAALKADRCVESWAVTETAKSAPQSWRSGGFEFGYAYQRADLTVRGPPIYRALDRPPVPVAQETTYTCSGMSAMTALLSAVSRLCGEVEVLIPPGCYSETRELLDNLGAIRGLVSENGRRLRQANGMTRILLLDSSVPSGFAPFRDIDTRGADLVLFDTTCLWQSSARIRRVVAWALDSGLPLALVRSHAKLDSLGIEYGRLGSVVLAEPLKDRRAGASGWMKRLRGQVRDSVRLLGTAPVVAHFPPFAGSREFELCGVARTAAIIRNNRRIARRLASVGKHPPRISSYQHGLYFTIASEPGMHEGEVNDLAAALCDALSRSGLPVRHSGSFGFDFTAIDCFREPLSGSSVIRVAASDIPASLADQVADGIARWWSFKGWLARADLARARRA